jgi:hypothetical protein
MSARFGRWSLLRQLVTFPAWQPANLMRTAESGQKRLFDQTY